MVQICGHPTSLPSIFSDLNNVGLSENGIISQYQIRCHDRFHGRMVTISGQIRKSSQITNVLGVSAPFYLTTIIYAYRVFCFQSTPSKYDRR